MLQRNIENFIILVPCIVKVFYYRLCAVDNVITMDLVLITLILSTCTRPVLLYVCNVVYMDNVTMLTLCLISERQSTTTMDMGQHRRRVMEVTGDMGITVNMVSLSILLYNIPYSMEFGPR